MAVATLLAMVACESPTTNESNLEAEPTSQLPEPLVEPVLTQAERDALSPESIYQSFKDGNQRFVNNELTVRSHSNRVRETATGQFPKAVVISCLDSRVPVEDVLDRGLGDIFVGRVAGNFVNTDLLGSMEFACKVAGAKVILILGHKHCGAVQSAIDDVQLGNITAMLANIKPAVEMTTSSEGADRAASNADFVYEVAKNNVRYNMDLIRERSPILKEMEDNREIKIVGGYYDITDGLIQFIE